MTTQNGTVDVGPWIAEDEDMIFEDRTVLPATNSPPQPDLAARITARLAELEQMERAAETNLVVIRAAIGELRAVLG